MLSKINFDKKTEGKITDRERKNVINKYRELLQLSENFTKKKELELIRKAFDIALDASEEKRSPSGGPAILDTLETTIIVVDQIGLGTRSVVATLLYQAVIDKKITIDEIDKRFGFFDEIYIWADIEGSELKMLQGSTKSMHKIKWLNLEVRQKTDTKRWCKASEVYSFLEKEGFQANKPLLKNSDKHYDVIFTKN